MEPSAVVGEMGIRSLGQNAAKQQATSYEYDFALAGLLQGRCSAFTRTPGDVTSRGFWVEAAVALTAPATTPGPQRGSDGERNEADGCRRRGLPQNDTPFSVQDVLGLATDPRLTKPFILRI